MELQEQQDLVDHLVPQDQQEPQELVEHRVLLVLMVALAPLVLVALRVRPDRRVQLVQVEHKDFLEQMVPLEPQDLLVLQD